MPRAGYDCTGIAKKAPGADVSTRTRHKRPGGGATPRATTPENQPMMGAEDPNATPRASRMQSQQNSDYAEAQNSSSGNNTRNRIAEDSRYSMSYAATANSNNSSSLRNQPPNNFPQSIFSQNSFRQVGLPQGSFSQNGFSNSIATAPGSGPAWNGRDLATTNPWNGNTHAPQAYGHSSNNFAAQGSVFASYGQEANMGRAPLGRTAPPPQQSYSNLPTMPQPTNVVEPTCDPEAMDVEFGCQAGRERHEGQKRYPPH